MNRCVAFAGPGTRGKPAGPVPLMSKRSTTATYFDHQGIMRTAQPYELRPNYVYKNGVWVQDGWLREGASVNECAASKNWRPSFLQPTVTLSLTTDAKFPNLDVWKLSGCSASWANLTVLSNVTAEHPESVLSVCVKNISSIPLYAQISGVNVVVDYKEAKPTATSEVTVQDVGDGWWRLSKTMKFAEYLTGYSSPAVVIGMFGYSSITGDVYVAAGQTEPNASSPSSWIPYGQTRAAD